MEWDELQLSSLIDVKHGYAFKSEGYTKQGDYVLLTPGNFREEGGFKWLNGKQKYFQGDVPGDYILNKGDLLVVMTEQAPGLLGSSIFITESNRYLHNQRLGLINIKDSSRLCKQYLYHLFNAPIVRRALAISSTGSKVKHTSPGKIGNVLVPVPSPAIQEKIANILDVWDRALEITAALITSKQKYFRRLSSILLFGQNQLRSGNKGTRWYSVPDHWEVITIGKLAKEVKITNRNGESLPVLSCTKYDGLVDSLEYFGKRKYSNNTSAYKIVGRDQFAYATNHIEEGSIGYQTLYPQGLVSPIYTVFETNNEINDRYLYKILKTDLYRYIFEINTSSSVDRRGSLRWKSFSHISIPLPPLDEQKKISDNIDVAKKELTLLQGQLEHIKMQKRGLVKKLFSGEWQAGK